MKKRILGNLLAVGLAAIAVFPLAACNGKLSAGELFPPDAEEAILPTAPEDPVFYGDCRFRTELDAYFVSGYLFNGRYYEPSEIVVSLPESFFYYETKVTLVETEPSETQRLELFMEYNHADWEGLSDLYKKEGEGAYLDTIAQWQAVYEEVKGRIPALYCYKVSLQDVTKEKYEAITGDPADVPSDVLISETEWAEFRAGIRHYFAPETDRAAELTDIRIDLGGASRDHTLGSLGRDMEFTERLEADPAFAGTAYLGEKAVLAASDEAEISLVDEDTIRTSYVVASYLEGGSEREFGEITLKEPEIGCDRLGVTAERIEVCFISLLGVESVVEWDGSSDLTIPVWNRVEGDGDYCRFCIDVFLTREGLAREPFNYTYPAFLTAELPEGEATVYVRDWITNPLAGAESYYDQIYAAFEDGVDIFAREKSFGNEQKLGTPSYAWHSNGLYRSLYEPYRFWEDYVTSKPLGE